MLHRLQLRPLILLPSPPPLLLQTPLQRLLLLPIDSTRHRPLPLRRLKTPLPKLIRQPQNPTRHRRPISSILPLSPRPRNLLREIPEFALGEESSCGGVTGGAPGGVETDAWGDFGVFGFDEVDHLVFGVAGEGVAEGFGVDGFEVGEVALVVEGFAELGGCVSGIGRERGGRSDVPVELPFEPVSPPSRYLRTSQMVVRDQ